MSAPLWVLDTNVIVSAALTPAGVCDQILTAAAEGQIRFGWSPGMLAEYRDVLARPKFGFSERTVRSILDSFGPMDQVAPLPAPALPDPDDEVFLATALATPDQVLVTGNSSHFPKDLCAPVHILNPAEALKLLSHSDPHR